MIEERKTFEISTEFYSKEAIINATYKYTDRFYIKVEPITETKISVIMKAIDNSPVSEEIVNQFFNELADQQLRINVEKEYKTIREEIVKKAFSSISK
jgi:His-Xaa-Ser system protein HxsD